MLVTLSDYSTIGIGHEAELFTFSNGDELTHLMESCRTPFLVLGNGSNLLFHKFSGTVLKNEMCNYMVVGERMWVQSGMKLRKACDVALEHGLGGLEWAEGIPATVGGAVYMNAGFTSRSRWKNRFSGKQTVTRRR
jgi:UDP-N-acetylmuramate dehydrogenase